MYDDKYDEIDKEKERDKESRNWDFREVEDAEEQRETLRRARKENEIGRAHV